MCTLKKARVLINSQLALRQNWRGGATGLATPQQCTVDTVALEMVMKDYGVCREAMQEFVDRVDRGEVRSTKTYNKFKAILNGED